MHTVTADKARRIRISDAKPGQVFALTNNGDGTRTLIEIKRGGTAAAKVTVMKEQGFTVGVLDRPINEAALKEALAEFP